MARRIKPVQRKPEEPKLQRVRYPSDGPIEALRGKFFEVPVTVAAKGEWIESKYRQQLAEEAAAQAAAEAVAIEEERNQAVLQQRISEVKDEPEVEVAEVEPKSSDSGLALAVSLANLQSNLLVQTQTIEAQQAAVAEMVDTTAQRLAAIEANGISREEAIAIMRNGIEMQNAAFDSYGKQLAVFQEVLNQQVVDIAVASQAISDNRETVEKAVNINETAISQATAAATEAVDQMNDDFVAFLTIVLRALGVDESTFAQELNAAGVTASRQWLTREYIAMAANIQRKFDLEPVRDVKAADVALNPEAFEPEIQG